MTDDRAALGARIAEAMGWVFSSCEEGCCAVYLDPNEPQNLVGAESMTQWEGYGVVDAWMREQGYSRCTWRYPYGVEVAYFRPLQPMGDSMVKLDEPDEPLAAALSMELALGSSNDRHD